jgi:hypothetical protein
LRILIYFACLATAFACLATPCEDAADARYKGTPFEGVWQGTRDLQKRLDRALEIISQAPQLARNQAAPDKLETHRLQVLLFAEQLKQVDPLVSPVRPFKIRLSALNEAASETLALFGDLEVPPPPPAQAAPAPSAKPFRADDHPRPAYEHWGHSPPPFKP